jgi:hypothetical protein
LGKRLLGDEKFIMGLKIIINQLIFGVGIRRNSSLRLLLHMLFFMDVKSGAVVSLGILEKDRANTKEFYNL